MLCWSFARQPSTHSIVITRFVDNCTQALTYEVDTLAAGREDWGRGHSVVTLTSSHGKGSNGLFSAQTQDLGFLFEHGMPLFIHSSIQARILTSIQSFDMH